MLKSSGIDIIPSSRDFISLDTPISAIPEIKQGIKDKKHFTPIHVQLSPTEVCDSDCPFCSVMNRPIRSYLNMTRIKKCLSDFASLGTKSIELTGGGNPLLYKDKETGEDINDIIRFAGSIGLKIGLITNSSNLKKLDKNTHKLIDWIRISLIKLDEGIEPIDYDFNGFPLNKLSFSYIIYSKIDSGRTKRNYPGTDVDSLRKMVELKSLYPEITKPIRLSFDAGLTSEERKVEQLKEIYSFINQQNRKSNQSVFYGDSFAIQDRNPDEGKVFNEGCYMGAIRPFVAPSPTELGEYLVYSCCCHMLFCGQNYSLDYSLCKVEDILQTWTSFDSNLLTKHYPYQLKGNFGKNWNKTCGFCYLSKSNKFVHEVIQESKSMGTEGMAKNKT